MGDVDDATACSVLLADADVLIDYLKSEFAILSLVAEYVGRVVVLEQVLGEVRCRRPDLIALYGRGSVQQGAGQPALSNTTLTRSSATARRIASRTAPVSNGSGSWS